MKTLLLVLLTLMLVACGGSGYSVRYARVVGPDGTKNWFALECAETFDCYRRAGSLCKWGYEISNGDATESTESTGSATRIGNTVVANQHGRTKRGATMLIHCKDGPNSGWGDD